LAGPSRDTAFLIRQNAGTWRQISENALMDRLDQRIVDLLVDNARQSSR
jgi:hypothetical protein